MREGYVPWSTAVGLTPHGVSGLKCVQIDGTPTDAQRKSHPAWGEWIEMCMARAVWFLSGRLTPHGVSGLK